MIGIASRQRAKYDGLMALTDDLVKAISTDGRTRYRIAQDSGISAGILSRLVNGHRGVSIETAERLAGALGYQIELNKPKGRGARTRNGR